MKLNQDIEVEKPVKAKKETRGRKPKESDKILEEDYENLDEGTTTVNEVAEKRGIKRSTVDNGNRRRREKLMIKLEMKKADSPLPDTGKGDISSNNFENPDEQSPQGAGIPADATEALKGMYSFLDTMLVVTSTMTKGRLEYTKLTTEEIDRLAVTSNQSPHLRNFAQNENLSGIVIAGTIIGTFGSHLKFNLEKRHDEKKALENKCECPKCLEAPKISKDDIETILNTEMKVNDIPHNVQKTPEEVIAQNTKKDVEFNDNLPIQESDISKDRYEASPEYVVPKTNDAGEKI